MDTTTSRNDDNLFEYDDVCGECRALDAKFDDYVESGWPLVPFDTEVSVTLVNGKLYGELDYVTTKGMKLIRAEGRRAYIPWSAVVVIEWTEPKELLNAD
jgi:hypothetical protein